MMRTVHAYHVIPSIPERLMALQDLAFNLRWTWDHETIALFRRLDRELWETAGHNPVRMLGTIDQRRLREVEQDESFLVHMDRVHLCLELYMTEPAWFQRAYPEFKDLRIGYFSAEFGLTECLPIYGGGLGILAGDHLKSGSELGVPLVAGSRSATPRTISTTCPCAPPTGRTGRRWSWRWTCRVGR